MAITHTNAQHLSRYVSRRQFVWGNRFSRFGEFREDYIDLLRGNCYNSIQIWRWNFFFIAFLTIIQKCIWRCFFSPWCSFVLSNYDFQKISQLKMLLIHSILYFFQKYKTAASIKFKVSYTSFKNASLLLQFKAFSTSFKSADCCFISKQTILHIIQKYKHDCCFNSIQNILYKYTSFKNARLFITYEVEM